MQDLSLGDELLAHGDQGDPVGQAAQPDPVGAVADDLDRVEAHPVVRSQGFDPDRPVVGQGQDRRRDPVRGDRAERQPNLGGDAVGNLRGRVRQLDLDAEGAGRGLGLGGDEADLARYLATADQGDPRRCPDRNPAAVPFADLGDGQHRIEIDNARDRIALVDEVADLGPARGHQAIERRPDRGIAQRHLGAGDGGFGGLQRGLGGGQLGLRPIALLGQAARGFVFDLALLAQGLGRRLVYSTP